MGLASSERTALADLFAEVGPERPTLCEGWDTGDLMSHLIIRERRPDAALGQVIPFLRGHGKSVTEAIEARPWAEQIDTLRSGPPGWNPMGWGKLEELSNGAEFFVHHEDVRRGAPGWEPRALPTATAEAVERILRSKFAGIITKPLGVGVTAVLPNGERIELRSGKSTLELHGAAPEIVLWIFGRDESRVELVADPQTLERVAAKRK
ncbi:TIGR03085 family metal-binding protein [Nakamurella sp. A5-74]|uniref:TIGR03085 family metal-binding protein n=1 Tax=Nakamurella sp. A5-74 TaxID=3158264 RepID=A0AAU8DIX8_9ACTN